jgi:hypothetical protein
MKISIATVAVWLAFAQPSMVPAPQPQPQPAKCCGECGGTGMVWSGDRLLRYPCKCPPTCPCAKNRPTATLSGTCVGGKCNVR